MGRLFNLDNPVMNALNKLADLIILNFLTMICCIPIFTIGASVTALHYVALKIVRDEETYIIKGFFKSFRQNFKQATIMWIIMLLALAVLIGDFVIISKSGIAFPSWIRVALIAIGILFVFAIMHAFPMLAKFDNTIRGTFKNSLYMGILSLPKTILMMVCWVIPAVIAIYVYQALPIVIMLGISGPAFLNALLYNKTFKRFEPQEEVASDEDWTVPVEETEEVPGDGKDAQDFPEEKENGEQL